MLKEIINQINLNYLIKSVAALSKMLLKQTSDNY